MKRPHRHCRSAGFTFKEMLVVLAILVILALVLITRARESKARAERISCVGRLKNVSLSAKQWSLDYTNMYPMSLSTNHGGTKEWIPSGETFRHFAVMSNELNTPLILACPSDRQRAPARYFDSSFSNSNISYFVGLDATDEFPQMILFGDRNIFHGVRPANGVVSLTTNFVTGLGPGLHNGVGNIALTDGSVQQLTSNRMREALANTGDATNRVQLP